MPQLLLRRRDRHALHPTEGPCSEFVTRKFFAVLVRVENVWRAGIDQVKMCSRLYWLSVFLFVFDTRKVVPQDKLKPWACSLRPALWALIPADKVLPAVDLDVWAIRSSVRLRRINTVDALTAGTRDLLAAIKQIWADMCVYFGSSPRCMSVRL